MSNYSTRFFPLKQSPQIHNIDTSFPQPLTVHGYIGSISTQFLIDTGSSLTLINFSFFSQLSDNLKRTCQRPSNALFIRLANKSPISIQWTLSLPIKIGQITRWHTVYVVRELWRSCIIGNDFILKHNIHIDGANQ